jgi:methionine-rich copper-binding protein CopC
MMAGADTLTNHGTRGQIAMIGRSWLRATLIAVVMMGVALSIGAVQSLAHASPESAIPPIDGSVDVAPPQLEIVFSQEVAEGTMIEVFGADGRPVHAAPAELDLNDPDRKRVTVPLYGNLPAGVYTVNWTSVSAEDGDTDSGSYTFTVTTGGTVSASASPAASPAASPEASPAAAVAGAISAKEQAHLLGEAAQQQATEQAAAEDNVDEGDLGLALLPGIGAAILIYLFWRLVRPKPGDHAAS